MRNIKLFDTYKGQLRDFVPLDEKEVDIYYCGPTVYNYVHLGNFRPTITFDLLTRFLTECGYDVKCVSNYTDIDDKIIKQAKIENKSEKELSEFYIQAYEDCLSKLNVLPLYNHPKASEYIPLMATFIKDLENEGYAYQSGEDIYFRVSKDEKYGSLSKQKISDLVSGSRIDVSDKKENPLDFALWKLTSDDGIKFDTIIGKGRPGWHTECVVMVNNVFHKPLIDIHGGGFDLKFPHHENEIAQSEAHNHTQLANYWMHVGFLLTDGVKMSKSLGNSILAKDVLNRYSGNAIRLFFLSTHYRAPVNYTEENLMLMEKQVNKYMTCYKKSMIKYLLSEKEEGKLISEDYEDFMNALSDDLNVANAISVLDKEVKILNSKVNKAIDDEFINYLYTYKHLLNILGFKLEKVTLTDDDKSLLEEYNKARENKDYTRSDELRNILISKGLL